MTTEISEMEIEAAAKALFARKVEESICDGTWAENEALHDDFMADASASLSAAALARAEANAEGGDRMPERIRVWENEPNGELVASFPGDPYIDENVEYVRADLAHPAPQPSGPVEVKPLEWRTHKGDEFCFVHYDADALGGSYCIEERKTGDFDLWTPGKSEGARFGSLEAAKAAAQADYERRILSALTAGKPEQECATEGCDEPATDYFERGGVGSHYCHDCHLKVQSVTTPPTAGGV